MNQMISIVVLTIKKLAVMNLAVLAVGWSEDGNTSSMF